MRPVIWLFCSIGLLIIAYFQGLSLDALQNGPLGTGPILVIVKIVVVLTALASLFTFVHYFQVRGKKQ